ncbi:MAG: TonB family protein [Gemmatimonadota bacterium]|nr:TonB family protein [Gemmatimonadota bacterium]
MTRLSPTNTRWRDLYDRHWVWAVPLALLAHAALFFFLPGEVSDRLHEALLPDPSVIVRPGSTGPMESVELRSVALDDPEPRPPPEPEDEEEVEVPVPTETASESITITEVEASPSEGNGTPEGVTGGEGDRPSAAGGGGGRVVPPRPVHLVIPEVPDEVDKKRARGESVHLLVHVLPDGTVGEVKIEKGSRIAALNDAALAAARRSRYTPPERAMWTRTEMRF